MAFKEGSTSAMQAVLDSKLTLLDVVSVIRDPEMAMRGVLKRALNEKRIVGAKNSHGIL